MNGSASDVLQWATHRLDDAVDILGRTERELGEVSDRLAEEAHVVVRRVEDLHVAVHKAWVGLDGVA